MTRSLAALALLASMFALLACADESGAPGGGEGSAWLVSASVAPAALAADGSEAATLTVDVVDVDAQPAPADTRMLVIGRLDATGSPTGAFGATGESQMFLDVADDGRASVEFRCTEPGGVTLLARLFTDEVGEVALDCVAP